MQLLLLLLSGAAVCRFPSAPAFLRTHTAVRSLAPTLLALFGPIHPGCGGARRPPARRLKRGSWAGQLLRDGPVGPARAPHPKSREASKTLEEIREDPPLTVECSVFSECRGCVAHPSCRFCLLREASSARLIFVGHASSALVAPLPRTGAQSSSARGNATTAATLHRAGLQGRCVSVDVTQWHRAYPVARTSPVTGYCGLIVPDYSTGVTCLNVEEGDRRAEHRDHLQKIIARNPLTSQPDDTPSSNEPRLSQMLKNVEDPAPPHGPGAMVFAFGVLPLLAIVGCGCCTLTLAHCCCGRCCCTRHRRQAAAHHAHASFAYPAEAPRYAPPVVTGHECAGLAFHPVLQQKPKELQRGPDAGARCDLNATGSTIASVSWESGH